MEDTLYKEEILEHYKDPQNFGKLEKFDANSKQLNPFCGDEIEIYVKFGKTAGVIGNHPEGVIEDISFQGVGCAISIASASLLTEYTKGKTKKELTKFSEGDMLSLLGIEVSQTRKKCALLALYTLRDCL